MKRMTKREIIEDTVEHFSKHPRALRGSDSMCVYYDPDTEARCAVGRFSASKALDIIEGSVVDVFGENEEEFDSLLKPEVQGHSIDFWEDLQLWRAAIIANDINYYLGVFSTKKEAAKARKEAEKKLYGEEQRS